MLDCQLQIAIFNEMLCGNIIESFLAIILRFLPTVLDSGIQIWNGFEIDQMVRDGNFSYKGVGRFYENELDVDLSRRKRSIAEDPTNTTIINITLTKGISLSSLPRGIGFSWIGPAACRLFSHVWDS